jgi:diguanylate cyclase (GGDEF)-like protein
MAASAAPLPPREGARGARLHALATAEQAVRAGRAVPIERWIAEARAWQTEGEPGFTARALWVAATALHLAQQHRDAEAVALQAAPLAARADDTELRGLALDLAARAACLAGDCVRTLQHVEAGLRLAQDRPLLEARLRGTMGLCLSEMGRYDDAIDTLSIGYALLETADEPQRRARLACELARALALKALAEQEAGLPTSLWTGRAERSRALLRRVIGLYRQAGDALGLSLALGHLGLALLVLGDDARALAALDEAQAVAPPQRLPSLLPALSAHRARAHLRRGQPEPALAALQAGFEAVSRLDSDLQLDALYLLQSRAFELARQPAAALESYKRFHATHQRRVLQHAEQQANALALTLQTERALRQARDERQRAAHFERQSLQDPLTGLANRRCLEAHVRRLLDGTEPFSIALIDLDHLKAINDTRSHGDGDIALRHVAQLLRHHCRPGDLGARLGGDEFAIVFAQLDVATAAQVCERLREAVRSQPHPLGDAQPLSVSIGVADGRGAADFELLCRRADDALYAAKHAGRNSVCRADEADPVATDALQQRAPARSRSTSSTSSNGNGRDDAEDSGFRVSQR